MRKAILAILLMATTSIAGCGVAGLAMSSGKPQPVIPDDNAQAAYTKDFGLPVNCRAHVQFLVDAYRAKKFSAEETMQELERSCGKHGVSWRENK